ncbi:hypothetical protein F5X71_34455 [Nocardia brasiliensis]|uniref:Uncharacterized protein n=1 Tax=Nocardia brasiliensis TaxID=37326 RepID=A0A6G9Y0U0_NOCBR|nr:hypothetical protein [Nocardia brasiliensis]QIS06730.1 hypothetical protein F5X71_34455 [Nocardia brasiliensis]
MPEISNDALDTAADTAGVYITAADANGVTVSTAGLDELIEFSAELAARAGLSVREIVDGVRGSDDSGDYVFPAITIGN